MNNDDNHHFLIGKIDPCIENTQLYIGYMRHPSAYRPHQSMPHAPMFASHSAKQNHARSNPMFVSIHSASHFLFVTNRHGQQHPTDRPQPLSALKSAAPMSYPQPNAKPLLTFVPGSRYRIWYDCSQMHYHHAPRHPRLHRQKSPELCKKTELSSSLR